MAISEQDIMEDLAYAESEGASDMMEDEFDPFNEYESDFAGSGDFADLGDFGEDEGDYFSGEDDFEADEADENVGQMLSGVLGAEDEDEFLGKLFSGAKNLSRRPPPLSARSPAAQRRSSR